MTPRRGGVTCRATRARRPDGLPSACGADDVRWTSQRDWQEAEPSDVRCLRLLRDGLRHLGIHGPCRLARRHRVAGSIRGMGFHGALSSRHKLQRDGKHESGWRRSGNRMGERAETTRRSAPGPRITIAAPMLRGALQQIHDWQCLKVKSESCCKFHLARLMTA